VLNALPGYLIRGENNDLLGHLQELFERLPRHREGQTKGKPRLSTPDMPFFGYERFQDDTYALGLRRLVDSMLTDDATLAELRCLGFKEIRYTPEDVGDKVDFLRRLYPGCGIVYNIRNPEAVASSEFQKNKPPEYFARFNAILRDLAHVDPNAVLVHYEDLAAGTGTLLKLFEFLQDSLAPSALAAVLAKKHSYHSIKKGNCYSNVPAAQVVRQITKLDLFAIEKMVTKGRAIQIGGFIVEAPGTGTKQFAKLLDSRGRSVPFAAEYGLPSPKIAKKIATEAAGTARFQLRFKRPDVEDMRLFFADDELAVTLQADRSP
jgi:hypothetical protein